MNPPDEPRLRVITRRPIRHGHQEPDNERRAKERATASQASMPETISESWALYAKAVRWIFGKAPEAETARAAFYAGAAAGFAFTLRAAEETRNRPELLEPKLFRFRREIRAFVEAMEDGTIPPA